MHIAIPNLFFVAVAALSITLAPVSQTSSGRGDEQSRREQGPRVFKGRVIAPVMTAAGGGAEWLERADRDETEQPDRVIEALKLSPGNVVADVGAGTGYFSIRIAKKIAPTGKVLATDVQPEMLRQLTENMKKAGVKNIERILATSRDAKLPGDKVDLVLMVDVYHELQDPEGTMAQIRDSIKKDGRLVLVEYRAEDPSVPIKPEHKTTLRQIRYEIEPMGFRLKEVFEFLPHQHVEVFLKADALGEDIIIDETDFPTIRRPGWAGVATAEPFEKAGFRRAFKGKDLTGWTGGPAWQVRNEVISGRATGTATPGDALKMPVPADNFEIDLQWGLHDLESSLGLAIGGKSQYLVRLENGVPYQPGYLETIRELRTGEVSKGETVIVPASDTAKALVFPGEWNRATLRVSGSVASVAINGVKTAEFQIERSSPPQEFALVPLSGRADVREVWIRPFSNANPK